MKNVLKKLLLPLVLCGIMTAQSQSECDLYINADFDSECLLTEYIKARTSVGTQFIASLLLETPAHEFSQLTRMNIYIKIISAHSWEKISRATI